MRGARWWIGCAVMLALCGAPVKPVSAAPCVGDCNGNGVVSVAELITGVNIALARRDLADCRSFDLDGDSMVRVNELIRGVRSALDGCEAVETPTAVVTETPTGAAPTDTPAVDATETPTAAATPTSEVPTATQTPRIENVAGGSVVVANALGGIANVIAAAVTGVSGGGGAVLFGAVDLDFCELGGSIERTGGLPSDVSITLTDCAVSRPSGSAVYDGTIVLEDVTIVSLFPPRLSANASFTVSSELKDGGGTTTLTTKSELIAAVVLTAQVAPGGICTFSLPIGDVQLVSLDLTLTGSVESSTIAGGSSLVFDDTIAELSIDAYQSDCVPSEYALVLNGAATASPVFPIATSGGGGSLAFALEFDGYTLKAVRDGETTQYEIDGDIRSECFGGAVTLDTLLALRLADGELCPSSGQLAVAGVGVVTYMDGAVSIDDLDPETAPDEYGSCLDLSLLVCPS